MENEFSFLEQRIIQSLISKKSFVEIAGAIDKPVDMITHYIAKITKGKNIVTRQAKIDQKNRLVVDKKIDRAARKNKELSHADFERKKTRELKKLRIEHDCHSINKRKRIESIFKTRQPDFSKMISVRIDSKTVLQVPAGTDIETLKRNYHQRLKNSKIEAIHYKVVKKFKP